MPAFVIQFTYQKGEGEVRKDELFTHGRKTVRLSCTAKKKGPGEDD